MTNPTVHFWKGDEAGCGFYRCEQPAQALRDRGWDATDGVRLERERFHEVDTIVGQRVSREDVSKMWVNLRKAGDKRLVYELDDDLFTVDHSNRGAHRFFMAPQTRQNIINALRASHVVIVSTSTLARAIRSYNKNIVVIPNFIQERQLDFYDAPAQYTVGWAGSATHRMDFAAEAEGLKTYFEGYPETLFKTIGVNYADMIGSPEHEFTDWCQDMDAYHDTLRFDVGIAPLRRHLFNDSKSWIKALEYAAHGIPTVATDYGPYPKFVEHGVTGFLADSPAQWLESLTALHDMALREDMRQAVFAKAKENTIEENVCLYEEVLSQS